MTNTPLMKYSVAIGFFCVALTAFAESSAALTAPEILALSDDELSTALTAQTSATATPMVSAAELAKAQAALQQKDAVIAKLSSHLSSALARLNQGDSRTYTDQRLAVAMAVKTRLEKENALLKQDIVGLRTTVAQSQRQMQLFDLENRRLVDAFSPSRDVPVERIAQNYIDSTRSYAARQ